MSTPTWIKDILRGGIPELLDLGDTPPSGNENQDGAQTRPEQNAPTGYNGGALNFGVSQNQMVTFAVIGFSTFLLFKLIKSV